MTVSIQKPGPEPEETLSQAERRAVNAFCQRYFNEWEQEGRSWEFVDFVRALNAGAAMTVVNLRAGKVLA